MREPPQPDFECVCYSPFAGDRALSILGRFAVDHAVIDTRPLPTPTRTPTAAEEAGLAEACYRQIVADTFDPRASAQRNGLRITAGSSR